MKTISKVVIYAVLACLILSWIGSALRPFRRDHSHHRNGGGYHRVLARLRRCRGDNPNHHPVRPSKNAVLPPDDDEVDPEREHAKNGHERSSSGGDEITLRSLSSMFGSRPLPTDVPRHQTLCILLI